jgi:N-acetylglucosamine kinase-like BadF-type ATPase
LYVVFVTRPLLGDEGSGYAIGSDLLTAVVRAVDGRGPNTMLVERVLKHLQLSKPDQLIEWTYKDLSWQRIAALSQLVFEADKLNDAVAANILQKAANGLLEAIKAVTQRLQFSKDDTFPFVFAGGNLTHPGSKLAQLLRDKLNVLFPNSQIIVPEVEPVMGAAYLAVQHYNSSLSKMK